VSEMQDGVEQMEVEVRVHRVRKRRGEPPVTKAPGPPNVRSWVIYAALTILVAALMFEGFLRHKAPASITLPELAEAIDVQSAISPAGDSLQVVVSWDLTLSTPAGRPDSIQVKLIPSTGSDSLVTIVSPTVFADTATVIAPPPGQTLTGSSCVTAKHADLPGTEVCAPWQYLRPSAIVPPQAGSAQHIVIQPSGLQVDQDVDGRCAAWQRDHPGESVWIQVNRVAVPECTGVNGKPMVAQFCAFALLPDGRKIRTVNSGNVSYCEELFVEWSRETAS
jgi:hypothetical protein